VNVAAAPPPERRVAAGVWQLELPSRTLAPFRSTWVTLLVSAGRAALVDPGFADADDAARLLAWAERRGARPLDRVLLSHGHRDHVDGVPALLAQRPDLTVLAHPLELARVPAPTARPLGDGRTLVLGGATIRALHTPGHAPGHLVFEVDAGDGEAVGVVAGDLVTGRGAPWIGVPEGDAAAYLASLERIRARRPAWLAVAHGPRPADPEAALAGAEAHRRRRERQLHAALVAPRHLDELLHHVYGELPDAARPRARTALLALLRKGMAELRVVHLGRDEDGPYQVREGAAPP
jgi:glyoxylase-like metal-dependent hydrolase (beta-lactamase superfamily II)